MEETYGRGSPNQPSSEARVARDDVFFAKPFLYGAHDKREFIPSWISAPVHHPQPRERCKACEEFDEAIQLLRLDRRSYERTGALLGSPTPRCKSVYRPLF